MSINSMKSPKGKLQVIVGPMFSGKTSELIRRLVRYKFAGYRVCLIFNAQDSTRNATQPSLRYLPTLATDQLIPLIDKLAASYDVIGIDEGHAFEDLVEFAETVSEGGKKVVVAALDGDYERRGFINVLNLIPLAESVVKLSAVCMSCANEAPYTRIASSFHKREGINNVQVQDKYMAVCQACYEQVAPIKRSPFKTLFKCNSYSLSKVPIPKILMETS